MKFYLLDDDTTIRTLLKMIIQDRQLGIICGSSGSPAEALDDLSSSKPDIIIVDLLMPEMDGITFINKAKEILPEAAYIMLSQVCSKDMIASAYGSGVEFFIQKPINSIEVESIIKNVCQKLTLLRTITQAQNLFGTPPVHDAKERGHIRQDYVCRLRQVLQRLGIIAELGSADIITLIEYLVDHEEQVSQPTLHEICGQFSSSPKSVEQRIRRTANAGLVNLAHMGIEDYSNDTFIEFSNTLYNFEQVRREMDFIRGKSDKHGNVKVKNFLNALLLYCTT